MSKLKPRFGVLIDLSGTIHIGDELVGNAKDALIRLMKSNIPYRFVTNTTKETKDSLVSRLKRLGLSIDQSHVFTSLTATRSYIKVNNLRPHLLIHEDALPEFYGINCENPNAVVIGLANEKFNNENMNTAFKHLSSGAELIAIHKARYYKQSSGLALGPGPFVAALEFATTKKAVLIGKPTKNFFLGATSDMECDNATYVMVGDDVKDDIDGAQKAGMKGILVKTGKYRTGDEHTINPPPLTTVETVLDAVEYVLQLAGE